jgi:hypothetical protein
MSFPGAELAGRRIDRLLIRAGDDLADVPRTGRGERYLNKNR